MEIELEDQVLKYFQQMLSDLCKLGESRPPSELFVSHKASNDDIRLGTGSILRRWKVDKNDSVEIPISESLPELDLKVDPKHDPSDILGYYPHGRASFSILSDPPRVRVAWTVGALYGRGFDIPIVNDKLDIEAAIPLWFSQLASVAKRAGVDGVKLRGFSLSAVTGRGVYYPPLTADVVSM